MMDIPGSGLLARITPIGTPFTPEESMALAPWWQKACSLPMANFFRNSNHDAHGSSILVLSQVQTYAVNRCLIFGTEIPGDEGLCYGFS